MVVWLSRKANVDISFNIKSRLNRIKSTFIPNSSKDYVYLVKNNPSSDLIHCQKITKTA